MTCLLVSLPPTYIALLVLQGMTMGFIAGGATDSYAATAYGGEALIVKVCEEACLIPSCSQSQSI